MSTRTSPWPAGFPCWADLSTPDVPAAKAFYGSVLGWTFADTDDEYGGYSIAQVGDADAAGIGPLQPDAPSAWTLYLASDDADATAKQVTASGGTLLLEPGDVGPMGRMFIGADPSGAAFGVWQAKEMIGAAVVNEPGGLTWEDLRSNDPDAARAFYTSLFGFDTENIDGAPEDYTTFALAGDPAPLGGMGGLMGEAADTPSYWLVYFGTADAAAAATAAEAGGGTVVTPAFSSPYGTMAGLLDPAGALFWVIETDAGPMPDRGE
jgi:predicted enzyme related to lactoylglutathione lyase